MGKVLEQGLMEVLEEEELAAMRAHQEHFEQVRGQVNMKGEICGVRCQSCSWSVPVV